MRENSNRLILQNFQTMMRENNVDLWIGTTGDCHHSEYTSEHFEVVSYLTGFMGSNAELLIMSDCVKLWTDGRYFIQAERELNGTGIDLMKMSVPGVPTLPEFICEKLKRNREYRIAFSANSLTYRYVTELQQNALQSDITLIPFTTIDFVDVVWKNRPAMDFHGFFHLNEDYCGKNTKEKLNDVRKVMDNQKCTHLFLNKLDDIMWLCNIRGCDVAYNPVAFSYLLVSQASAKLFILNDITCSVHQKKQEDFSAPVASNGYFDNEASLEEAKLYLKEQGITLCQYQDVSNTLNQLSGNVRIMGDLSILGYDMVSLLIQNIGKSVWFDYANPTELMKSVKNKTEIRSLKKAYLADSVAVCRFLCRMEQKLAANQTITETDAAFDLDSQRSRLPGFLELSFPTISAYGSNAAMMHYQPSKDSPVTLKPDGSLFLIDSGGQYLGGTTDVTRTIAIGEPTYEEKRYYTAVVKGMLQLQNAVFLHGCTGLNLDIMAREPLWRLYTDYRCGTGHGIGFCLNVHEGPQAIRWRQSQKGDAILEEGMVLSDEPGCYREGEFGIRIENILLCISKCSNSDGSFLGFEPLTYVPFDRKLILTEELTPAEITEINEYHKMVYDNILGCYDTFMKTSVDTNEYSTRDCQALLLSDDEKQWLYEATKPLETS